MTLHRHRSSGASLTLGLFLSLCAAAAWTAAAADEAVPQATPAGAVSVSDEKGVRTMGHDVSRPDIARTPPVGARMADPVYRARLTELSGPIQAASQKLKEANDKLAAREKALNEGNEEAKGFVAAIAELQKQVAEQQAKLKAVYAADPEWKALQETIQQTDAELATARKAMVDVMRDARSRERDVRDPQAAELPAGVNAPAVAPTTAPAP